MIRKATSSDIDAIIKVTQACAEAMIKNDIYQWNANYPNAKAFQKDVDRDELFVLIQDETLIGTIVISTFMDAIYEPIEWLTPSDKNLYIHRLAVHPDYQGQGYAQQLMTLAENLGKTEGCTSIRLDTFSQNRRNQSFYERRGYQRLGSIYFPQKSDSPFYCYELIL